MNGRHTARIGDKFNKELEDIKYQRLLTGKDKIRLSTQKLTNLIIKHNYWHIIKKEIIELEIKRKEE